MSDLASDAQSYTISLATRGDIPEILKLTREQAAFLNDPHGVSATEERLGEAFEDERWGALIARHDGDPVGLASFAYTYSIWLGYPSLYLEDVYVAEAYRGSGLGKNLLGHFGRIALERGCGKVEWFVHSWNRDAIGFYEDCLGATPQEVRREKLEGREKIEALARLAKGSATMA